MINGNKLHLKYTEFKYQSDKIDTTKEMQNKLIKSGFFDFKIKKDQLFGIVKGLTIKEKSLNKLVKK